MSDDKRGPMCGGASEMKPVDDTARKIVQDLKPQVEEQLKQKFDVFEPVSMRTQVVAGVNYFVKVKVSPGDHVHLRIYRHFGGDTQLHGVQKDKKHADPVDYFDQHLQ